MLTNFLLVYNTYAYLTSNTFQVLKVAISTKMDNYIYLHHSGQFFHKNHPTKIQTAIGQKLFVNVNHEMAYSLETFDENGNQKCTNQNNNELDDCIVKVRFQITILFQIY